MKQAAVFLLVLLLVAGCVHRVAVYSPRRSNTEEHRNAKSIGDCLGCHDVTKLRYHSIEDDCFRCHKLCRGC